MSVLELLRLAAERYDADPRMQQRARAAKFGGFSAGLAWMVHVSTQPGARPYRNGSVLGFLKYGGCSLAAVLAFVGLRGLLGKSPVVTTVAAVAAFLCFYLVEANMVFVFPAAASGSRHPFRDSRALVARAGGTLRMLCIVLPIAWSMLSGGMLGRGVIRSWAVGCLAVLLLYERLSNGENHGTTLTVVAGQSDQRIEAHRWRIR